MERGGSGPFGLRMGATLEELESLGLTPTGRPCMYTAASVPRPHSGFEIYALEITPQFGLSFIKALGRDISTNSRGTALRGEFESLETRLSAVYGSGKRTDAIYPDSIWNEPSDFMMGLQLGERILATSWKTTSQRPLKDSLAGVILAAQATDQNTGFLGLEYYFENQKKAQKLIDSLEDDVL